ncbi:hypothetical protein [Mycolicibacterium conceptionense]|uniref:hypothetical protein n=1 Tax=Mycolicibacterium conceptionense TaxID=451644 RepID=UPI000B28DDE3|nr:hypothetical protein [Mycolicibacterium conceptionense]
MSNIPAELNDEVERILTKAHAAELTLIRENIVFSPPDWLTIDGMDPDEWIEAMTMD